MGFVGVLLLCRHQCHHFMRGFQSRVLVLAGDKALFVIHGDMGCENIDECRVAFINDASFTQFGFRVQRGHTNTQLFDLFVGDAGHFPACDKQFALRVFSVDQTQYAMAHTADNRLLVVEVGCADFFAEHC